MVGHGGFRGEVKSEGTSGVFGMHFFLSLGFSFASPIMPALCEVCAAVVLILGIEGGEWEKMCED